MDDKRNGASPRSEVVGGAPKREGLLVGLKNGHVMCGRSGSGKAGGGFGRGGKRSKALRRWMIASGSDVGSGASSGGREREGAEKDSLREDHPRAN